MDKHRRIIGLRAENFKKVRLVELVPNDRLNVIGGNNGAGKSSLIDAIAAALGGGRWCPSEPVRAGEAQSVVLLDLGDIEVRWSKTAAGKPSVTIQNKEGMKFSSPQAVLDRMIASLGFDPSQFLQMGPAEQKAQMITALDIETEVLEQEHRDTYDERTEVNRELKRMDAMLRGLAFDESWPDAGTGATEILNRIRQKRVAVTARERVGEVQDNADCRVEGDERAVKETEAEIHRLQGKLRKQQDELENLKANLLAEVQEVERAADQAEANAPRESSEDLQAALESVEQDNAHARAKAEYLEAKQAKGKLAEQSEALSAKLTAIEAEKARRIAVAEFPVPGLSFDDTGLRLNGQPFSQASHSEQLRVAVAMAVAANPDLRVVLFRDGSVYDRNSWAMLEQMAKDFGVQFWIELVGDDDDRITVLMEEGEATVRKQAVQNGA